MVILAAAEMASASAVSMSWTARAAFSISANLACILPAFPISVSSPDMGTPNFSSNIVPNSVRSSSIPSSRVWRSAGLRSARARSSALKAVAKRISRSHVVQIIDTYLGRIWSRSEENLIERLNIGISEKSEEIVAEDALIYQDLAL